jgi:alanine racemase
VSFSARAVIRLGALEHNFRRLRDAAHGARVMAVLKANAYGHGLLTVARCLTDADAYAVARYGEAIALQEAGVPHPIVLLQGTASREDTVAAVQRGFELVVHCEEQVRWLEAAGAGDIVAWLKVDTGMRRLGFEPEEAADLLARLNACAAVGEARLMTHLSRAEDREDGTTGRQLEVFRRLLDGYEGDVSIVNSAGLLAWPDAITAGVEPRRCWVRAGLALYGISPFADTCGAELGLRPAMDFEARLISVKPIGKGEAVGYGGTWRAPADTVLGIVSAGYGDGYSRFLPSGTPLLVNGRRVALAGIVSMDMAAADLGPGAADRVGDPVLLWGEDLPVEQVAAHAGASPYQLVCGVSHRDPPRILP